MNSHQALDNRVQLVDRLWDRVFDGKKSGLAIAETARDFFNRKFAKVMTPEAIIFVNQKHESWRKEFEAGGLRLFARNIDWVASSPDLCLAFTTREWIDVLFSRGDHFERMLAIWRTHPEKLQEFLLDKLKIIVKNHPKFVKLLDAIATGDYSITYSSLSVNVIVNSSYWYSDRSRGVNFPLWGINFIANTASVAFAIDHENTHAVMSGLFCYPQNLQEWDQVLQSPSFEVDDIEKLWIRFLDGLQDEIIANFDEIFDKRELHTEKQFLQNLVTLLRSKPQRSDNISLFVEKLIRDFLNQLANLVFVAQQTGQRSALRASMIIFPPSKYAELETYLSVKVGGKNYAELVQRKNSIYGDSFFK